MSRTRTSALACSICIASVAIAGCAQGGDGSPSSRRSAGTLTSEVGVGSFDAWEVLVGDDASVVIAASGVGGARGTVSFGASDDGSFSVFGETDGESSELDFGADGALSGEAHAPRADAMLAELVADLRDQQAELVARVISSVEHTATHAAFTGSGSFAFGCAWDKFVAGFFGGYGPVCDAWTGGEVILELRVASPWPMSIAPEHDWVQPYVSIPNHYREPIAMADFVDGIRTATVTLTRTAIERRTRLQFHVLEGLGVQPSRWSVHEASRQLHSFLVEDLAPGTRHVNLVFSPTCGSIACPTGACAQAPTGGQECVQSISDRMFPIAP